MKVLLNQKFKLQSNLADPSWDSTDVTHDLHTKGRYISFAVIARPFVFSDEIEIFKGNDDWLSHPRQDKEIASFADYPITSAAQRRLYNDISAVKKEMDKTHLSAVQKSTFRARLDKDGTQVAQMPKLSRDFKTILPLNDTHRDILAVRGELLAAQGMAPLTVWRTHRYTWLSYLTKPKF